MGSNAGRPDPVTIVLTEEELVEGGTIGVRRQAENIRRNRPDAYGCKPEVGWQVHVEGALAERSVAKLLGAVWTGNLGDLKASDVGRYQVRSTSHPNGRLIIHDRDADDDVFILITGLNGTYHAHGWIMGNTGKRENWRDDPTSGKGRPAYFVPRTALQPMSRLPQLTWVDLRREQIFITGEGGPGWRSRLRTTRHAARLLSACLVRAQAAPVEVALADDLTCGRETTFTEPITLLRLRAVNDPGDAAISRRGAQLDLAAVPVALGRLAHRLSSCADTTEPAPDGYFGAFSVPTNFEVRQGSYLHDPGAYQLLDVVIDG